MQSIPPIAPIARIAHCPGKSCLLLLAVGYATLFFRLGGLPYTGSDEPRYARISQEMYRGDSWVTPTLEGRPWLEKPPLYYWASILFYRLLGISETTARLASALSALAAALGLLWLGRIAISPRAGLYAGLIFLTSFGITGYARNATTDMIFTSCWTLAVALLGARVLCPELPRAASWLGAVFLGLSILAKGPVGIVLALGVFILYWWWDERGGALLRLSPLAGPLLVTVIAAPWFWLAYRENGFSFITVFLINHNLARYVTDIHHHVQPFYYYLPVLVGFFFPWTGWLPLLADRAPVNWIRNWKNWSPTSVFLLSWFLVPLVVFSFSQSKLPGYVLPCLAPLALLLGRHLAALADQKRVTQGKTPAAFLILTLAIAVALPVAFEVRYDGEWRGAALTSLFFSIPALLAVLRYRQGRIRAAVRQTVWLGVILLLAMTQFLFPVLATYHSTRDISRQALQRREANEPIVTFEFFHHTLNYYTDYQVAANLAGVESLRRFAAGEPRFLVVTEVGKAPFLELQGYQTTLLGRQGKFLLFRVSARDLAAASGRPPPA